MMENHYSIKTRKIFLALFVVGSIASQAQHKHSKEEVRNDPAHSWKRVVERVFQEIDLGVNLCTKMTPDEATLFERQYALPLLLEQKMIFQAVRGDSINEFNADQFISSEVIKYSNLFKKFKAENGDLAAAKIEVPPVHVMNDTIRPDPGPCQPACANLGFEDGTMNNWVACGAQRLTIGANQLYPGSPGPFFGFTEYKIKWGQINAMHLMKADCYGPTGGYKQAADCYGYLSVVTGPDYQVRVMNPANDHIDPTVPTVYPGMTHSVMLGDSSEVAYGSAMISQKFMVTKANAAFSYVYALFLESAGHSYWSQPYFRVSFYDQNGDTIKGCGNYVVVAGPDSKHPAPGFYAVNEAKIWKHNDTTFVKPWTCVFVSLRKYIGQCVTVQFVTGDCDQSAHFGYAYVAAKCNAMDIKESGNCKAKTLTAPIPCGIASYQWIGPCISGSTTGQSITVTCDGIYKLILTPTESGCADTLVDTVKFGVSSLTPAVVGKNLKCNGDKSGSATASINGVLTDYDYSWSPSGGTAVTANGLAAGTYSIKITSKSGCGDTTVSVTLTEPPVLTHTTSSTPATCGMSDGSASVVEGGGTSPYSYSWMTKGVTTPNLGTVKSGTYTVNIKDGNGCKDSVQVIVPGGGAFTATPAPVNIICYGGNNGSATVNVSNGNPPYIYSWLNGGPTTSTYSGLVAGSYTCIVNDQSAICADTVIITLTQPAPLKVTAMGVPETCFGSCDGQANIIPAGGITPYSYIWSNATTTASLSSLCKGTYTVTITDKNGCQHDTSLIITEPPAITFVPVSTPTTCNKSNGSASVTVGGGTGPYVYLWSNKATGTGITFIPSGTYTLTATDSKGCKDSVQVLVPNVSPEVLSIAPPAKLLCHGDMNGSLSVSVVGSGAPYTYSWSSGQTSSSISNMGKGIYTVSVTDVNGCVGTAIDTIQEPPPLLMTGTNDVICNGNSGTMTAIATGGTSPYTYMWNKVAGGPTGTYTPTATTAYAVETIDANGCVTSMTDSIKVNPMPQAAFSGKDVCVGIPSVFTDSSYIAGNGIINSWLWDFGDNSTSSSQNPSHTYSKAGTYSVSLIVNIGPCSSTIKHTVNVYPTPTADFSASPQPTTVLDPMITFKDLSIGGVKGKWDFGDFTDTVYIPGMNPAHMYPSENIPGGENFVIKLSIVSKNGCPDEVVKSIHIDPEWTFYVPNAFSPNGDGKNEGFYGTGVGIVEKEMWIFDRWGLMIFHTTELNGAWDGKVQGGKSDDLVQQDVYVWMIKIKEVFGKTHKYLGHVTVVR